MRLLIAVLFLSGCAFNPINMNSDDRFKFQACAVVYCESSEDSKVKKAGLKLLEIVVAIKGGDLNLGSGFCKEYYDKRELLNGWVWARRSAYDICTN